MVNKVILLGRVGSDPQARVFEDGTKIVNVRLATSEKVAGTATKQAAEYTQWHQLVFRKRLADIAEMYLRKGGLIYVEGKIRTRQWEDATKQTHVSVEIHVDELKMISSPQQDTPQKDQSLAKEVEKVYDSDELPF